MTYKTIRDRSIQTNRPRRESTTVDIIIIHAMSEYVVSDGRVIYCTDFLNEIQLGAHYFISPDGVVTKGCDPRWRTPHVGRSAYLGRKWLNETSIGIEFLIPGVNSYGEFLTKMRDVDPFSTEQYEAGGELIARLKKDFPEINSRITGHSHVSGDDVRGERRGKEDPGEHFNWEALTSATELAEFNAAGSKPVMIADGMLP